MKVKHWLKFFYIFFLLFLIHTIFIVFDGLYDESGKSTYGVILGNKVNEDGTLSERLEKRMQKGLQLFSDSLIDTLVVSGGKGKEGHNEGTVMAEYLIAHGVPSQRIIIDNEGNTTHATAVNCRKLLDPQFSVTVISQYHHISRTKLAFKKAGFSDVKGAHAEYCEIRDFYSIVREFFGYYKYLIR
ncbi:MAG: YdcF family protein [Cytophagaceae bacterium]